MLVPAEVWNVVQREGDGRPIVLVRPVGSEIALPILIDNYQASSILLGMRNRRIDETKRPHTHDLFVDVLERLGVRLTRIEITTLEGDTFYGRLILEQIKDGESREPVTVDSRPSDCIALAVRAKCPMYVDEELVSQEGKLYQVEGNNLTAISQPESNVHLLQEKLRLAVESENYEEAARLRDLINKHGKDDT